MAVGGYGRGALAPFSDIDLLFLRPYKQTAHAESVIEYMLYALWDLGFKVGHASRTVEECVKLSREDFTIRTSILEARRLTGDEQLADDLERRFRERGGQGHRRRVRRRQAEGARRAPRAAPAPAATWSSPTSRRARAACATCNTLFWIAQYLHPVGQADRRSSQLEMFDRPRGRDLHPRLRLPVGGARHLHFATGRAEERLTFDLQPEIARRMGYGDRGDAPAVERFMRRYFLIAKEVGALTRVFCRQARSRAGQDGSPRASRASSRRRRRQAQAAGRAGLPRGRRPPERRRPGHVRARSGQPAAAVRDRRPARTWTCTPTPSRRRTRSCA